MVISSTSQKLNIAQIGIVSIQARPICLIVSQLILSAFEVIIVPMTAEDNT